MNNFIKLQSSSGRAPKTEFFIFVFSQRRAFMASKNIQMDRGAVAKESAASPGAYQRKLDLLL